MKNLGCIICMAMLGTTMVSAFSAQAKEAPTISLGVGQGHDFRSNGPSKPSYFADTQHESGFGSRFYSNQGDKDTLTIAGYKRFNLDMSVFKEYVRPYVEIGLATGYIRGEISMNTNRLNLEQDLVKGLLTFQIVPGAEAQVTESVYSFLNIQDGVIAAGVMVRFGGN